MRSAPPAGVTCTSGGAWRAAQVALCMLTAAVVAAWAVLMTTAATASVAAALTAAVAAVAAGAAAWRATPPVSTRLAWDGERWLADGEPGAVAVMLDLGGWLLLRFRPDARPRRASWLPVVNAPQPLRSALYAYRPAAVEPRGG